MTSRQWTDGELWADGELDGAPGDLPATLAGSPGDRTPLHEVRFVVLDLETTGGAPQDGGITEIGAVAVRGGEVLGEFHTLVRPVAAIPAFISVLTGITDAMVAGSPSESAVLPSLLEFLIGGVLVAHNAPYDVGFLRAAAARSGYRWPAVPVVDTVRLARQIISRDEVPDRRLGTLARYFGSPVRPDHRALTDARATVHVLHALLGRIGSLGVTSLGELRRFSSRVPEPARRKRHLADGLPAAPGVYLFHGETGEVLYVGTSRNIHDRVRSYFTAAERRSRMAQMVARATRVTAVPCATPLEGRIREIRLIAEHAPPYNRRSRNPERAPWLKLTVEPYPRLSVVREVRPGPEAYLGPFRSGEQAGAAAAALSEAFPLRTCTARLPRRPSASATACLLADLGRCGAPCVGGISADAYAQVADGVRAAMTSQVDAVVAACLARAEPLAAAQRYEEAALHRDRLLAFLHGAARIQRLAPLAAIPELVAAHRPPDGGWELVLVRHGRLAGTALSPQGADPMPYVEALRACGEVVAPGPSLLPAAHPEESELLLGWLERPGVRLVEVQGTWAWPVRGAAAAQARVGTPVPATRRWSR